MYINHIFYAFLKAWAWIFGEYPPASGTVPQGMWCLAYMQIALISASKSCKRLNVYNTVEPWPSLSAAICYTFQYFAVAQR